MQARWKKLAAGGASLTIACGVGAAFLTHWLGGSPAPLSAFEVRAQRRAYDGAPPVIPHPPLGGACTTCHTSQAREVPGVGVAPPNPHLHTEGLSEASRCRQCHVFAMRKDEFVSNEFAGLAQRPRHGERLFAQAPPIIPHHLFMREDCTSCHAGPTAREEIRCSHAERARCLQCHARRAELH